MREIKRTRIPVYKTELVCETEIEWDERIIFRMPSDVVAFLIDRFDKSDVEEFVMMTLSSAAVVTGFFFVSKGGLAASIVEIRAIFRRALLKNAAAIVVAHNHPSGNLEPSAEDIRVTRQIAAVGELHGIPLRDHLIICPRVGYTSMAERGHLSQPIDLNKLLLS